MERSRGGVVGSLALFFVLSVVVLSAGCGRRGRRPLLRRGGVRLLRPRVVAARAARRLRAGALDASNAAFGDPHAQHCWASGSSRTPASRARGRRSTPSAGPPRSRARPRGSRSTSRARAATTSTTWASTSPRRRATCRRARAGPTSTRSRWSTAAIKHLYFWNGRADSSVGARLRRRREPHDDERQPPAHGARHRRRPAVPRSLQSGLQGSGADPARPDDVRDLRHRRPVGVAGGAVHGVRPRALPAGHRRRRALRGLFSEVPAQREARRREVPPGRSQGAVGRRVRLHGPRGPDGRLAPARELGQGARVVPVEAQQHPGHEVRSMDRARPRRRRTSTRARGAARSSSSARAAASTATTACCSRTGSSTTSASRSSAPTCRRWPTAPRATPAATARTTVDDLRALGRASRASRSSQPAKKTQRTGLWADPERRAAGHVPRPRRHGHADAGHEGRVADAEPAQRRARRRPTCTTVATRRSRTSSTTTTAAAIPTPWARRTSASGRSASPTARRPIWWRSCGPSRARRSTPPTRRSARHDGIPASPVCP